jgi:hypothetical protein
MTEHQEFPSGNFSLSKAKAFIINYKSFQFPPAADEIGVYETQQDTEKVKISNFIGLPKQRYEPSSIMNERHAPEPFP